MEKRSLLVTLAALGLCANSSAATISVNFLGNGNLGTVGSDTPAQIVGINGVQAQDWVNVGTSGITGSATAADIDGGSGLATLSYTSGFQFNTGGTSGTENHNMMDGAIRLGGGGDSNPTISGLGTEFTVSGYNVIVYFGSDNHDRTHRLTLGGIMQEGLENPNQAYNGSFTLASNGSSGNYMVFSGLTAASFTISDNGTTPGKPGIAGLEIVSVPEPSSAALLGLGVLGILLRRRN